jgi:hypothetical protein
VQEVGYELIVIPIVGILLIFIAGTQYKVGKVYTRGGHETKWHKKAFVSREEAPLIFWIIIGLQSILGLALVLVSGSEIINRLY